MISLQSAGKIAQNDKQQTDCDGEAQRVVRPMTIRAHEDLFGCKTDIFALRVSQSFRGSDNGACGLMAGPRAGPREVCSHQSSNTSPRAQP